MQKKLTANLSILNLIIIQDNQGELNWGNRLSDTLKTTNSLHDLCQEVLTVHGNKLRLFMTKAFPLLCLLMAIGNNF